MSSDEPDLTGMTFHEIAAEYGKEAAIEAGIASDPEWGPEEMDMSGNRPAIEVMPDLVEQYRRYRAEREGANMDGQDGQDGRRPAETGRAP